MPSNEMKQSFDRMFGTEEAVSLPPAPKRLLTGPSVYDPEMLYVECHLCGKPVLWEPGKTTELLLEAGVDLQALDERCLIVSDGCPMCCPHEERGFTMAVVRVAGLSPEEAALMSKPGGTA